MEHIAVFSIDCIFLMLYTVPINQTKGETYGNLQTAQGGLKEALAEAKEFESIEEMKKWIYEHFKFVYADLGYKMEPFGIDDIVIG